MHVYLSLTDVFCLLSRSAVFFSGTVWPWTVYPLFPFFPFLSWFNHFIPYVRCVNVPCTRQRWVDCILFFGFDNGLSDGHTRGEFQCGLVLHPTISRV